jgi:hypothetical protein
VPFALVVHLLVLVELTVVFAAYFIVIRSRL